ncbi:hypothetical protein AVMA1855_15145 [Acidovorax sp. SUPP1855]|uniref:hypothetical protein n=1 Tax=Acidovorax sp. SUPP1855 TaxID=431774 RepID=UPI0023DE5370|nr:hypothetical protein [Acidovorax sp. SUPP1855]GKS85503.1 hypothetical protein AVMA1855_15145 [Acidovorax sp. SUPP1855]
MHAVNTARQTRYHNAQAENFGFCALAFVTACHAAYGVLLPLQSQAATLHEAAVVAQELGGSRFVEFIKDD